MKFKFLSITVLLGFTTVTGTVCAETLFVDPYIPDGERITYATRVGDKSVTVVERVAIIRSEERR